MPPPPCAGSSSGGCGQVRVVDARILALVRGFPIVAVATSHDVPAGPPPPPALGGTLDGSYEAVRAGVERVRFAQLGLALASRDGDLALGRVWRFHQGDHLGAEDKRFLAAVAVDPGRPDGVLVTRDGAEDVAYVVRHLKGVGALPPGREEFLRAFNTAFPELYDLKVMAEWTTLTQTEPPLAATWRDAFRGFLALVRDRMPGDVLVDYNAFLFGLGAADTIELMSIKRTRAKDAEGRRQMKELFRELCPGQDPANLDSLPFF
uniref:Uncharacterized protein n=1 Tax=Setaria italica TaxID=4555 RepID=K3ZDZ7_SETIT